MKSDPFIAVASILGADRNKAIELSKNLSIPLVEPASTNHPFLLISGEKRLVLQQVQGDTPLPGPIYAEFLDGRMGFRSRHGGGRKQNIARAVGVKSNFKPIIIDATAGLGRDGFVLAGLGCTVLMVERSPIIAALLRDGLQCASQDRYTKEDILPNITLITGDSIHLMASLQAESKADVIYLDPMFPHRTKSSLVKKEMRYLRALVGEDIDSGELLDAALQCQVKCVVVKRPRLAEPLLGPEPSTVITGKSSRYDVYFPVSLK